MASSIPKWIKAIPESQAHGSGTLQKRLWKLVSDFVRIRDWHKHKTCVATGKYISRWQDGQAGHFKAYSSCNGMFKFDERNIYMQSAQSNSWGGYEDWIKYETELLRRNGYGLPEITEWNLEHKGEKPTDSKVIEKMEDILEKMKALNEQPDYYKRVMSLK